MHTKKSLQVALYFLKLSESENKPITNLKLQKLVYYAQVWYFTTFNKKLFNESIEAWIHGPAIPCLYRQFKAFGSDQIKLDDKLKAIQLDLTKSEERFLKNIWDVYGSYDAGYLEALTHSELPWQHARTGLNMGDHSNEKIDLSLAKKFYASKLSMAK